MAETIKPERVTGWISVSEAAQRVGCTRDTIYKAIESKALTSAEIVGKKVVSESEISSFVPRRGGVRSGAGRRKKEPTND